MSVPKQKTPKSKTRRRRSHLALKPVQIRIDEDGNPHLPHHVTKATGKYRGKQIIKDVEKRIKRAIRNRKTS